MRLKNEHAKNVMALDSFSEEKKGEWREETQEQADCGRYGHLSDCEMEWYDIDGDNIAWYKKRFDGVCVMCGARRL